MGVAVQIFSRKTLVFTNTLICIIIELVQATTTMVSEAKGKGKERVKRKQTESKAKGKPSETQKTVKLKTASKDKALKASTASSNWLALQKVCEYLSVTNSSSIPSV